MVFRACRLLSFQSPRQDFSFPFQHNNYNIIFIISQIIVCFSGGNLALNSSAVITVPVVKLEFLIGLPIVADNPNGVKSLALIGSPFFTEAPPGEPNTNTTRR